MVWAGRLRDASRVVAAGLTGAAVVTLALQAAGVLPIAAARIVQPPTMAPATALALLFAGASLWLRRSPARSAAAGADAAAMAAMVVAVAGLFARAVGLIRPGYNTVSAFVLLAGALLVMDRGRPRRWPLFQWLACGGGLIALLATAGYVYGSPPLYRAMEHDWGMALPTAVALLLLSVGILWARPERGLVAPLTLDDVRGRTLRRVLPALFAVPLFALGLAVLARSEAGWLPTVAALLAGAGMLFGVWLASLFANTLAREAAAEERLRHVIESTSDPIVDATPDGIVRGWNRAAERVFGYRADEMIGRSVSLLVPPEARDRLSATLAAVVAERRSQRYEGLSLRKDGSTLFSETTISPLVDGRGEVVGLAAVAHDLSARKRAEEALARAHASEQRRREALERVNAATDVVAAALAELPNAPLPVLLQLFVEQAAAAVPCDHAIVEEAGGGGPIAERGRAPAPRDAVTVEVPIAWRQQRLAIFRLSRPRAQGGFSDEEQVILKLLAARAAAAVEISRTYSREARERAWLASAIDQIPEPVVLVDAGGRLKHVNPAALRLTSGGRGASSELGFELRRPGGETIALDQSPLMRALLRREVVRGEEIRVGDGEPVPMEVTAAPVVDAAGGLLGAVMVARDLSAQKALERLREEWTSVVAHDLRQPVSVIHMTAQRLLATCPQAGAERELLSRVLRAAQRLNRMIADLLDMSQLEAHRLTLTKRPADLREVVGETVRDLGDVAAPHPTVVRLPGESLPVEIDGARIVQVLSNLITNAAKYSASDSDIVVEARRAGDCVEVAVANRGPGIRDEDLAQLFGDGGTGLGPADQRARRPTRRSRAAWNSSTPTSTSSTTRP